MRRDEIKRGQATPSERDMLPAEDRAFVAWLESAYRPKPQTPVQAAAWNARLYERLERRRMRGWQGVFAPLALAGAAACAIVLAFTGLGVDPAADGGHDWVDAARFDIASALIEYSDAVDGDEALDDLESLPDDYMLLAALLDGEDDAAALDEYDGELVPQRRRVPASVESSTRG
jgi:hypothetical protein